MGYGLGGNDRRGGVCCARLFGSDGLSCRPGSSLNFVHAKYYQTVNTSNYTLDRSFKGLLVMLNCKLTLDYRAQGRASEGSGIVMPSHKLAASIKPVLLSSPPPPSIPPTSYLPIANINTGAPLSLEILNTVCTTIPAISSHYIFSSFFLFLFFPLGIISCFVP